MSNGPIRAASRGISMTFLRRLSVGLPLSRLGWRGVLGGRVAARRGRRREHQGGAPCRPAGGSGWPSVAIPPGNHSLLPFTLM